LSFKTPVLIQNCCKWKRYGTLYMSCLINLCKSWVKYLNIWLSIGYLINLFKITYSLRIQIKVKVIFLGWLASYSLECWPLFIPLLNWEPSIDPISEMSIKYMYILTAKRSEHPMHPRCSMVSKHIIAHKSVAFSCIKLFHMFLKLTRCRHHQWNRVWFITDHVNIEQHWSRNTTILVHLLRFLGTI